MRIIEKNGHELIFDFPKLCSFALKIKRRMEPGVRFYFHSYDLSFGLRMTIECTFPPHMASPSIAGMLHKRLKHHSSEITLATQYAILDLLRTPINFHHFNIWHQIGCGILNIRALVCGGVSNKFKDEEKSLTCAIKIFNYINSARDFLQLRLPLIVDCRFLTGAGPLSECRKFIDDTNVMVSISQYPQFNYFYCPLLCNVPMEFIGFGKMEISDLVKESQERRKQQLLTYLAVHCLNPPYERRLSLTQTQLHTLFVFWQFLFARIEHVHYVFMFCTVTALFSQIVGFQMLMGCHFGKDRTSIVEAGISILIPILLYRLQGNINLYSLFLEDGTLDWEHLSPIEQDMINNSIDENFLHQLNLYSIEVETNFSYSMWKRGFFSKVPTIRSYKPPVRLIGSGLAVPCLAIGI